MAGGWDNLQVAITAGSGTHREGTNTRCPSKAAVPSGFLSAAPSAPAATAPTCFSASSKAACRAARASFSASLIYSCSAPADPAAAAAVAVLAVLAAALCFGCCCGLDGCCCCCFCCCGGCRCCCCTGGCGCHVVDWCWGPILSLNRLSTDGPDRRGFLVAGAFCLLGSRASQSCDTTGRTLEILTQDAKQRCTFEYHDGDRVADGCKSYVNTQQPH
jgi:hypothetical protein